MDDQILRTVIEFLYTHDEVESASILSDCDLEISTSNWSPSGIIISYPSDFHSMINSDTRINKVIKRAILVVTRGHLTDQNGNPLEIGEEDITFRIRLSTVEDGWRNFVKSLIHKKRKDTNQGNITEISFVKINKEIITYNEMKFASKTEVRIAQELESRNVLFFPLPLAVRGDTGNRYNDRREPDFLICNEGKWGILEIAFHPNRYEVDREKSIWFKDSGILCIEHYTAEKCYNEPKLVINEFLEILKKHK